MTQQLGYPPIFGLVGAAAVEFLGLSAVHTAVTFWQWNDHHKIERAPFWFALGAGLFYVLIVLTVNAALDIWRGNEGVKILAHALLSLLSVDAAVIIAIRAQHARRLTERDEARQERKAARQAHRRRDGDATRRDTRGICHDLARERCLVSRPWRMVRRQHPHGPTLGQGG
jgi:hypothetical protein